MTAIGKLLALLNLVAGLGILTWSVGVYVERPGWFADPDAAVDKGSSPVTFKQLKIETDALTRGAGVASEAWGTHLKTLEEREKLRAGRRVAYAERLRWAHKGNPKDAADPTNPKSPGKGFYEPVIDPATDLHDLTLVAGLPKGKAVLGTDGNPLPGLDGLLDSLSGDVTEIQNLNAQIMEARKEFDKISANVVATEIRAIKMNEIRDSVQAELFFLSTFEVNVFETRATVIRRERQLRDRLKILGVTDP
jgi:hypothetical protein